MISNSENMCQVGRKKEMKILQDIVRKAKAQEPVGTVVFVEGVAGLGKSACLLIISRHISSRRIFSITSWSSERRTDRRPIIIACSWSSLIIPF